MSLLLTLLTLLTNHDDRLDLERLILESKYIYLAEPVFIYETSSKVNILFDNIPNGLDRDLLRSDVQMKSLDRVTYVFKIKETIIGKKKKFITLDFLKHDELSCNPTLDFDLHRSEDFWKSGYGRSILSNVYESHYVFTCFKEGFDYLLIDSRNIYLKSYEVIKSVEDEWYKFILQVTSGENAE